MARWRGTTTERGLGWSHVKKGHHLRAAMRDGELCWRCGLPMYHWQKLDQDHLVPRVMGGADGPTVLAHQRCNRSAGARLGNRQRGAVRHGQAASRVW